METLVTLSFDQALTELEGVVQRLEGAALSLEETVALYQRGRMLAEHCQHLLDEAELRISRLVPDGTEQEGAGAPDEDLLTQ
jgi:exodeoxyribonuclease VII small subunit